MFKLLNYSEFYKKQTFYAKKMTFQTKNMLFPQFNKFFGNNVLLYTANNFYIILILLAMPLGCDIVKKGVYK